MYQSSGPIRRLFVNIVCGLFYKKTTRKTVRAALNTSITSIIRFIRQDCGIKHPRLKFFTGYAGRNLVVQVNKKYIYKFQIEIDKFDDSLEIREQEITSALGRISPILIPAPIVSKYRHGIARRYDFIDGISLRDFINNNELFKKHRKYLIRQIAEFLYAISTSDPDEIKKYKPRPNAAPAYMFGWHHGDISDNFIVDPETFKIKAFIDWEDVKFGDFSGMWYHDKNPVFLSFMIDIGNEYERIYKEHA